MGYAVKVNIHNHGLDEYAHECCPRKEPEVARFVIESRNHVCTDECRDEQGARLETCPPKKLESAIMEVLYKLYDEYPGTSFLKFSENIRGQMVLTEELR